MHRRSMSLLALAATSVLAALPAVSPRHLYQRMKPVTDKDIGRNWLKSGRGARHPHSSTRQQARYARQIAAGQLCFRPFRATGHPGRAFAREGGVR